MQKDNFEKQSYAIKSDADLKLAEVQSLLEAERDHFRTEIENLRKEKENLAKTLFDERSQRCVLEGMHHASVEAAVLIERQKITRNEEREKQRLQRALDEERRRSWTVEQQTKQEYERALEDEKKRTTLLTELEREGLEKSLQEEKRRISELEERLVKSPCHERYTQTITMFDEPDFPRMPPGTNQTETLYNVLLAEIMSLQLLYQMQDLSHACNADDPKSRDSGCAEYEDEVIHSVSSSVLEKGGLLLNNLRGRQGGASRFSLTSTDSLRELYLLQFPPSPKLSRASHKTESVPIIHLKSSLPELHSDSNKSFLSTDCDGPRGQDGTSSSSMESFLEEPLSPRSRHRPCDSGCSSQHSDSDHSPGAGMRSQPIDIVGRTRALSNPVNRFDASACVPLAEGEDEDSDLAEPDEIQTVKKKVVHLENDLCRLKTELDAETMNFFSEVFRVEVPFLREGELSRLMRRLFEGVKEKLLYRICAGQGSGVEEEEDELDLSPPVLEEAVNLLLVSKTVMSCLLVLQNRRDTEKNPGSTTTELPTVIHVPSKVDQQTQTDPEAIRSLRRRIRKDVGVGTDLPIKIQLRDKECQTSVQELSDRVPELNSAPKDEILKVLPNLEAWNDFPNSNTHRTSQNSIPPQSRDPDGASSEEEPAVIEENREEVAFESRHEDVMSSGEDDDLKETKGKKKKKARLFACLSPPRLSFRKKSKKASRSEAETTKLVVKEI